MKSIASLCQAPSANESVRDLKTRAVEITQAVAELSEARARIIAAADARARRSSAEDELFALLAEKIYAHDGDFDEWLREGDPEDIGFAHELVVSAYFGWRPATRAQIEGRLEAAWDRVYQDINVALESDR